MGADATANLTIMVPTCERYPFLTRLLRYYRACGAPVRMHILDSSQHPAPGSALERLLKHPAITYTTYDADLGPIPKLYEGVTRVTTPYAVVWADDDLMVPQSMVAASQFLEEHSDFSNAHGVGGLFRLQSSQHSALKLDVGPFIQRSLVDDTASSRLANYLTKGCSLFHSVHRTRELRRNLEQCVKHQFGYYWGEVTLAWLSTIQGKAQQLNRLSIMRQIHDGRGERWDPGGWRDSFGWVSAPSFPEQCDRFLECVSRELMQQDGMSFSRAHELVREVLWRYLARALANGWKVRYGKPSTGLRIRLRETARRIPWARDAWRTARGILPGSRDEISLPALRRRSSPYYTDFAPIYQAITEENGQG